MRKTNEEKGLLAKLASGILDGMVGDERVYRGCKMFTAGSTLKMVNRFHIDRVSQKDSLTVRRMSELQERERKNTLIQMKRN